MTDTIIKGSGNSRSIITVPNAITLYPTHEELMQKWATEGIPVDIGAINPGGVETLGTLLNKANLLKDSTAALFGLGPGAVPDDVFSSGLLQIDCGFYIGDETGDNQYVPASLTFRFAPKIVMIPSCRDINGSYIYSLMDGTWILNTDNMTTEFRRYVSFGKSSSDDRGSKKSDDGKTIYWYTSGGGEYAYYSSAFAYYYIAIG